MASRPILVLDTSIFLQDAFSRRRKGAATQLLTLAPAVAHIVMCDEIRDEILEKFDEYLGWSKAQVLARYGPVLDAHLAEFEVSPTDPLHLVLLMSEIERILIPRC